jgi:hypothetical protein
VVHVQALAAFFKILDHSGFRKNKSFMQQLFVLANYWNGISHENDLNFGPIKDIFVGGVFSEYFF